MTRFFTYLHPSLAVRTAVVLLVACTREDMQLSHDYGRMNGSVAFNDDGTLGFTLGMEIPGMAAASTRALGAEPDYGNLDLYLLVFDESEGLVQYADLTPERINGQTDNRHGHQALVTYKLSLEPTENPATVHLIATNQPDFKQQIGYGTEERLISSLYTYRNEDGTANEAYWQRIVLGSNIPSAEQADPKNVNESDPNKRYSEEAARKAEAIAEKMRHVPMIRNFCRVSVDNFATDQFTLTGIFVLNTSDCGTVAPYVAGNEPEHRFVDYFKEESDRYEIKSYAEISAQNHIGTLPAGVQIINKLADVSAAEDKTSVRTDPVYFYERPARVNSTERTYVILRGLYKDPGGDERTSYYKVDLGRILPDDVIGLFEYYNLLRGFDYNIRLNHVDSFGFATMEEAARGPVFNNFAASVEARTMTNISDGADMIAVNFTTFVFTYPKQTVDLEAQYRTSVSNGTGGVIENGLLHIKWEEGDVINTIEEPYTPGDVWNTYVVHGNEDENAFSDVLKQQTVYVYRGNRSAPGEPVDYGLYRVINFYLRNPWSFEHMDTFPGLWTDMKDEDDRTFEWDWSEERRQVDPFINAELTLFFELPPGLPQAIFPLDFIIESDRQNIQNAYEGNAVVQSVRYDQSLFYNDPTLKDKDGNVKPPSTSRIQYVKTVTWENYNGEYSDEEFGTGTFLVRCRFRTITDLRDDNVGTSDDGSLRSVTTLRVYNPYFGRLVDGDWKTYHEDGFIRAIIDEIVWDFSDEIWNNRTWNSDTRKNESFLERMNSRYDKDITQTNATYDIYKGKEKELLLFTDGTEEITVTRYKTERVFVGWLGLIPIFEERTVPYDVTLSKPTLGSGSVTVDGTDYKFVSMSNADDKISYTQSYNNSSNVVMEIGVMSTDYDDDNDSVNTVAPRIEISNVSGGVVNNPASYVRVDNTSPYPTYYYEVNVPASVSKLSVDIKPPIGDPKMRVFKITLKPSK